MTTTRSLPALGFDPTPGDVSSARDLARSLGNMSTELGSILSDIGSMNCGSWRGRSAEAFIHHLDSDLQPAVQKCHDSFDQASTLLYRWADQLDGFQSEAAGLEREAATRQGDVSTAQAKVNGPIGPHAPAPAPGSPEAAQKAAQDAKNQQALTDAHNAMKDVLHRADELHDRFLKAAKTIADQLHHAGKMAPGKPGLFDSICNDIGHAFTGAWHWVEAHADAIKFVGDLLGDLSGILGILAIITAPFEPIGGVFAALSAGTAVLALGTHLLAKAAGANVSWVTLGTDVMGVLPGVGMLGKSGKVADTAVAESRAASLGRTLGKTFESGEKVGARNYFGAAKGVENARLTFGFTGKEIAIWGTKTAGTIAHDGSFISRSQMIIESKYALGQMSGTKLLNFLPKIDIDPLGPLGRTIDAGSKILPKLYLMPHGLRKDLKLGDPFHAVFG